MQGRFEPVQLQGPEEEEEPLQGRFEPVQLQGPEEEEEEPLQGRFEPVQREAESSPRRNNTGLPDGLKSGVESLSGISLDDVDSITTQRSRRGSTPWPTRRTARSTLRPARNDIFPMRHGTSSSRRRVACSRRCSSRMCRSTTTRASSKRRMRWVPSVRDRRQHQPAQLQRAPGRVLGASARPACPGAQPGDRRRRSCQRAAGRRQACVHPRRWCPRASGGEVRDVRRHGEPCPVRRPVEGLEVDRRRRAAERPGNLGSDSCRYDRNRADPGRPSVVTRVPQVDGCRGVLAGSQGYDRLLAMKMQHVNVGQNLQDLVTAAAGPARPLRCVPRFPPSPEAAVRARVPYPRPPGRP